LLAALGFILLAGVAFLADRLAARFVAAAGGELPPGWRSSKDPMGFSVSIPSDWAIRPDHASGRVEIAGPEGEQVIVWPIFVPASAPSGSESSRRVPGGSGARVASLEAGAASSLVRKLAAKLWPEAVWGSPEPLGSTALRQAGRVGDRRAVVAFNWFPSPKGTAGVFYAALASEARYGSIEETLARILGSFRIIGAATQPQQAPTLSYVRWHDPRENAFSLEVPSQWRVAGGLFRFASVDTRSAAEAVSSDGQIRILLGDAEVPSFTEPNPTLAMGGFREGSWYSPGYGFQMLVRSYVPGTAFAAEQVRNKVARGCDELSVSETRDRADLVQAINRVYAQCGQMGVMTQLTAGETAFTCRSGSTPMRGYYFAATQLTRSQGPGLWSVPYMGGYLGPAEKAGLAQAAFEHMVKSAEVNPQWAAMQSHLAGETSRIVTQTHQEISSLIDDTYWHRQGVMDGLDRRRSNAILGVEDVVDPATGGQFKVESGSNYYWIDPRGTVVGTDTDTRPNLDFRQLLQLP
jgi:hypothetical protein